MYMYVLYMYSFTQPRRWPNLFSIGNVGFQFLMYFNFLGGLFRAAPAAYGGSQARDRMRAVATGLHHSHSNAGSQPLLQPTSQLTATLDPSPTERGQGWNLCPHGCQSDSFILSHDGNSTLALISSPANQVKVCIPLSLIFPCISPSLFTLSQ